MKGRRGRSRMATCARSKRPRERWHNRSEALLARRTWAPRRTETRRSAPRPSSSPPCGEVPRPLPPSPSRRPRIATPRSCGSASAIRGGRPSRAARSTSAMPSASCASASASPATSRTRATRRRRPSPARSRRSAPSTSARASPPGSTASRPTPRSTCCGAAASAAARSPSRPDAGTTSGWTARPTPESREEPAWLVASRHEQSDLLVAALERLSPPLRAVARLRFGESLSYEEVGAFLGIAIGTVKSRLWRARLALERALEPARARGALD